MLGAISIGNQVDLPSLKGWAKLKQLKKSLCNKHRLTIKHKYNNTTIKMGTWIYFNADLLPI